MSEPLFETGKHWIAHVRSALLHALAAYPFVILWIRYLEPRVEFITPGIGIASDQLHWIAHGIAGLWVLRTFVALGNMATVRWQVYQEGVYRTSGILSWMRRCHWMPFYRLSDVWAS